MKKKNFKISDSTLFVYRGNSVSKSPTETDVPTDPTTTMITITKTGMLHGGRSN
ncbi:hypothetical protein [Mucilaginibacter paludis]|uniref:Uncharacterized protein n=1 Tax=Mucilaginibacter paludis DSM 18603 TaxID=714943 RepID=H1YI15_9SPHI|nr:hypothetical protein [Mucilaginibacter paludis]EHQ25563.1 hypothetical protein Mucpa_1403 [Mucilaginibacter paludis DSM 18603]